MKKGSSVWVHNGGKGNPLVKGTIVKKVKMDGYQDKHYIIAIETGIDPLLLVRDHWSISPDHKGPINMYRR